MTLAEYRKSLTERFREKGFESPELEADYIISEVTHIPHIELVLHPAAELSPDEWSKAENFASRRFRNEPFQYIFGWTPFREIDLEVGPGVLIPRPETEALVDLVLPALPRNGTLCELGVGSGAISLSAAFERSDVRVYGSEISPDALSIAERNREKLHLADRVKFSQGDLFSPFAGMRFNVIAANLPYIPDEEKPKLPPNVRDYEPPQALFAADGGFAVIERALNLAPDYLKEDSSALFFELGEEQTQRALSCAEALHFFSRCVIEKDPFGVPRFLCAYR